MTTIVVFWALWMPTIVGRVISFRVTWLGLVLAVLLVLGILYAVFVDAVMMRIAYLEWQGERRKPTPPPPGSGWAEEVARSAEFLHGLSRKGPKSAPLAQGQTLAFDAPAVRMEEMVCMRCGGRQRREIRPGELVRCPAPCDGLMTFGEWR